MLVKQDHKTSRDLSISGRSCATKQEAAIRELQEELASHVEAFTENPVPIIIYHAKSLKILKVNKRAIELYGYTAEQFCNLKILDLFAQEMVRNRRLLAAELRKATNNLGPFVHRNVAEQETVVSLISFSFRMKRTDTRVIMIHDETARHTVEEALRSSEERYRELFENANDVIFLHDLRGTLLAINRAAESLTGYSRDEVLGRNFDELVSPEARHQTHDSIRAHLGGSAAQHYELPILTKSNVCRFLEVSTRMIYRRGRPIGVQGIGRDVTERKQAQQRLLESARQLQEKNEELSIALKLAKEATQLKEQFLANTSHELRTPMNGIMGMINLLKSTDLTEDQREYADIVSHCANDLLTIINDILDLSQIEAGRLSLMDEPFDMHDSLKSVIKLLGVRASAKNVALTFDIDPELPVHIYGDCVRFRQILTNLIANAVKFTLDGGVHVKLVRSQIDSHLRCEVIDSGIGVQDQVRERIFEAFVQADGTTKRRFGGTGLGLTISKQLVETMGGHIGTYNNQPGPGATFWFEIPLRPANEAAAVAVNDSACVCPVEVE